MKAITLHIDTTPLDEFRRIQSQIIRRAYNAAKEGKSFKSIKEQILKDTDLDGHLLRCGVQRGIDLYNAFLESKQELNPIFGGKREFGRRARGSISKDEWKKKRTQPLYSVGQANVGGNRKFILDYANRKLIFKDQYFSCSFDIPKLKPNWEVILEEIATRSNNKEIPLTYMASKNSVSIIFDEQKLDCYKEKYTPYRKQHNRYMGIDLNPDRIVGIAIVQNGELIHSEQYELKSEDQNKRRNEWSHICQEIYKIMKHYGVSHVGMEDLSSIKQKDHNRGKKNNRLLNQWIRTFVKNKIKMICGLTGTIFCNINPAYSSFIGTIMNPWMGDCCGAAREIARRCSYQKGNFYPSLIKKSALIHRWKEMVDVEYKNWIELYEIFKIRDMGWRSPPHTVRSSKMGPYSEKLLVYPLCVSN